MAFRTISAAASQTTSTTSTASSHPIPIPTGTGGGILVLYGISGNAAYDTVNPPASPWVSLFASADGSGDNMVILWLPPGNTPSGSETIDTLNAPATPVSNRSFGYAWRISGEDAWTPQVASAASASSTTPDPPDSGSLSWGSGQNTFMAVAIWKNSSGSQVDTYPTGYTNGQVTDIGATGAAAGVGVAAAQGQITAISDNPSAFSFRVGDAARNWLAQTIGIKFVASADTTPPAVPSGLTLVSVVKES